MDTNPHNDANPGEGSALRASPPTDPFSPPIAPGVMPPPRTVWPTVLGVISVVLGVLGTLHGVIGLLSPLIFGQMRGATQNMQGFDPFSGMDQYQTQLTLSSIATLAVGLMLAFGGVLLLMRKRASRGVILAWAALKMAVVSYGAWLGWLVNQAQFAAMQQSGNTPAGMGGFMDVMSAVGVALTLAWGAALPIFMLVWFMRARIRAEVAGW